MNKKPFMILQIAATYIGTVVGAGFATGQSIMQFFTVYGAIGGAGILVSTILFIWIGTKMMVFSHRIKAYSFQELNNYLFGKWFGRVANILTFLILFGVSSVMLSSTGSIFEEQLGLPYQLAIILTITLSYLVMSKEMKGILTLNSLVTPMMLGFTLLIAFNAVELEGLWQTTEWQKGQLGDYKWIISPFVYASLNFAFVQAVLVPLGSEAEDESVLRWGGFLGGLGIGLMLLISHFAMNSRMPEMNRFEVPMAEILRGLGGFIYVLFLFVIFGEILTTLFGNVFGITRQIRSLTAIPKKGIVLFTLLACFLISQVGFTSLLAYLYPLIGYMGMILLILLAVRRLPRG